MTSIRGEWVTPPLPGMDVMDHPREWYTPAEVAALFRIQRQTVYEWVKLGRVESPTYVGRQARFSVGQVARMSAGLDEPGTWPVAKSPQAERVTAALAAKRKRQRESAARAERRRREKARKEGGAS